MPKAQSKSGTVKKSPAKKKAAPKGPEPVYIVQRTIGYAYGGNQVIMMHVFKDELQAAEMVEALNKAVQDLLGHRIEHFGGRTVADAYEMVGMISVEHKVYPSTVAQAPSKIIT